MRHAGSSWSVQRGIGQFLQMARLRSCLQLALGLAPALVVLAFPSASVADPKSVVDNFGTPNGVLGGQLVFPKAVAVNQSGNGAAAGNVYVTEAQGVGANPSHRISQFTRTGDFVRTWGYDVVASGEHNTGVNEKQSVTLGANTIGGTFQLRVGTAANTSAAIPCNATPAAVQSALEGIGVIGAGNVEVTSLNAGGGDCAAGQIGGPYTVEFKGAFAGNDAANMTSVATGLTVPTGGTRSVAVTVVQPGGGFEICEAVSSPADVCKGGIAGATAGQLNNPSGIALDQSNGYIYVTSNSNRRIDVFSPTGQFAGAFGWDVAPANGAPALEVCTTACQAPGAAGSQAGNLSDVANVVPGIDPNVPGRIYVPDKGNLRVAEYDTTISGGTLTAAAFVKAFGWGVSTGAAALESCTSSCLVGTSGAGVGQFTSGGSPTAAAVDGDGAIYTTSGPLTSGTCSPATPCRVQKFAPDASSASVFGPTSGIGQLEFTSGTAASIAVFNVAVDPANDHVFVLRKGESNRDLPASSPTSDANKFQVVEYDDDGAYVETHPAGAALRALSGASSATGLAVGTAGRIYASWGTANAGQVSVLFGPIPPAGPTATAVTAVGTTTATLNGTVDIPAPGSEAFNTTYRFEYSSNGVTWTSVPAADQSVGDGSTGTHTVSQSVTGLSPHTTYLVRLVATTGASVTSNTVIFITGVAAPRIEAAFVDEVTQDSARLGAQVDPEGLATTYHFEWGLTGSYGNRVPLFERHLGNGNTGLVVNESIDKLEPATTYHYRVVATSPEGTTTGPDQTFETLNSCGLTDNRCYELVSPPDKGPTGNAVLGVAQSAQLQVQVSDDGSNVAYNIGYGGRDATSGGEVLYRSYRHETGWLTEQLTPPAEASSGVSGTATASLTLYLGEGLQCGVEGSVLPLAEGVPEEMLDKGKGSLFRRNPNGTYTTITTLAPSNDPQLSVPAPQEYSVAGASRDCGDVVFSTTFAYPGVGGAAGPRPYWWSDGTLSALATVPSLAGPVDVEAVVGSSSFANSFHAVAADGSRVAFGALRQLADGPGGPAESGKRAVFVRERGSTVAVDVSKSQTSTPSTVADYQTSSLDGRFVVFIANYGLTSSSSSGAAACDVETGTGCDLYRYDVETGDLVNLSADANPADAAGAGVVGVMAASDDAEYVYFAARGQLVPGEGSTYADNVANDTYSVYLKRDGAPVAYAGTLDAAEVDSPTDRAALMRMSGGGILATWMSRATPSGSHLLFASSANVTGYVSAGAEVYRYSAVTGRTECLSCRRDGKPSAANPGTDILATGRTGWSSNNLNPPRTITDDGSRAFFRSEDRLATGAVEGEDNLYQWENGQVSLIGRSTGGYDSHKFPAFLGVSRSGDDLFFATYDRLTGHDFDGRTDVYNARVDGGFPDPPVLATPCDVLEDGCQSAGQATESPSIDRRAPESEGQGGPVRPRFALAGVTRVQRAALAAGRRVRLRVSASAAGTLSLRGSARVDGLRVTVLSASRRFAGPGKGTVGVRLTKAARQRIARTRRLRVVLTTRFTGAARPRVIGVTLRRDLSRRRITGPAGLTGKVR